MASMAANSVVTLFTGLNLNAGTYYVTLVAPSGGWMFATAGSSAACLLSTSAVAGVVAGADSTLNGSPAAAYPPASDFSTGSGISGQNLLFQVTAPGPMISGVQSAASQIDPSLPNGGVAQGSIFLIRGSGLGPASLQVDSNVFQDTSFDGTSVAVTVGGVTVNALLYYTESPYVAALLPSNTPTGVGTITVTYAGLVSKAAPISVVANNLGIFTYTQDGQGIGIVTFPNYTLVSSAPASNCGAPITACGAANPADTLILWATGLGPISGSDAAGAGLSVNMPNIPVQLWLGGVSIAPSYQGRSGCCIGEDQIVFTVPANVATGCAVPLVLQIGDEISNSTVMAVAPAGSRRCTPSNPALASAGLEQAVMAGPITYAQVLLSKNAANVGGLLEDGADFDFVKALTYNPGTQPFFNSYLDDPPLGTCVVYGNLNPHSDSPVATSANADAGTSFSVQSLSGNGTISVMGKPGEFTALLSGIGTFLAPGSYTVTGGGGTDIGGFSVSVAIPTPPLLTSPVSAGNLTVTRSDGMTFTWNSAGAGGNVQIQVQSATDSTFTTGATAQCTVAASAGAFTIPSEAMLALPAGASTFLIFLPKGTNIGFSAPGLNFGEFRSSLASPRLGGFVLK
jgi:uncharacterized protein (TIGR03437 family)